MAPSSSSAQAGQHKRAQQGAQKAIVPAIPLPFIQKRKQQEAAREKAKQEPATPATVALSPSPPPAEVTSEVTPAIVNGSSDIQSNHEADQVSEASPELEEAPINEVKETEEIEAAEPRETEMHKLATSLTEASVHEESVGKKHKFQPPKNMFSSFRLSIANLILAKDLHPIASAEVEESLPSAPPSSASLSTFHMPPAFVPASQPTDSPSNNASSTMHNMHNGERVTSNIHHGHPSNGSIVFGGYPDSTNSSPAPPLSAGNGNVPQYLQQQQHYVNQHATQLSNGSQGQPPPHGYSTMTPLSNFYPREYVNGPPGFDNYTSRQMAPFGPSDNYVPSVAPGFENHHRMASYVPSTPHSVHGSQASMPNEQENGVLHATAVVSNGSNGHINDVRVYQQQRPTPPLQNNYIPMPLPVYPETQDGLIYYLLGALNDGQLADYVLELRYPDDTRPPQIINGHSLMLARSPKLKSLIEDEARARNGLDESNNSITRLGQNNGLTEKRLLLVSDDRYLRPDGFSMAIRRLYGGHLLDASTGPANYEDRFDFALGYAAAGHLLKLDPVFGRGVEVASSLLNWGNIEKALDFALDGGLDAQWYTAPMELDETGRSSTYGPVVNMLIYRVMEFIIINFPPNFVLDTFAGEPTYNGRLPAVTEDRRPTQNPRLSHIKFGDHSITSPLLANFSRVLLNLPYHLLKYVLESPNLPGARHADHAGRLLKLMNSVVGERERRRHKVISSQDISPATKEQYRHILRFVESVDHDYSGKPFVTRYDPNL
jgi:hypothetical protein